MWYTHCCLVAELCPTLFSTPWTVAHQTPSFVGFPRQEYQSGLPFPSPRDLPDPGIGPSSPVLAGKFFTTEPPGKPIILYYDPERNKTFTNFKNTTAPRIVIKVQSPIPEGAREKHRTMLKFTTSILPCLPGILTPLLSQVIASSLSSNSSNFLPSFHYLLMTLHFTSLRRQKFSEVMRTSTNLPIYLYLVLPPPLSLLSLVLILCEDSSSLSFIPSSS